jgi:hypothetical protein
MAEVRPASITIGELEANYPLYCKAMRILLREGKTLRKIQRTVCWSRLEKLHSCYPTRYKDPEYLYLLFRKDLATPTEA